MMDGVPAATGYTMSLATNTKYCVSFDYKCSTGTNNFDVDLFPDTLPQIYPTATTTWQHYDWVLSSTNSDMSSCQLRFFDDQDYGSDTGTISIKNIKITQLTEEETKISDKKIGNQPTVSNNPNYFSRMV